MAAGPGAPTTRIDYLTLSFHGRISTSICSRVIQAHLSQFSCSRVLHVPARSSYLLYHQGFQFCLPVHQEQMLEYRCHSNSIIGTHCNLHGTAPTDKNTLFRAHHDRWVGSWIRPCEAQSLRLHSKDSRAAEVFKVRLGNLSAIRLSQASERINTLTSSRAGWRLYSCIKNANGAKLKDSLRFGLSLCELDPEFSSPKQCRSRPIVLLYSITLQRISDSPLSCISAPFVPTIGWPPSVVYMACIQHWVLLCARIRCHANHID